MVITGASALGLPGTEKVFDDANLARMLPGEQLIAPIPMHLRRQMVDKHITRLVKREIGDATFEEITDDAEVIKLAGRAAPLDVVREFGVEAALDSALDDTTRLSIGAGIDALRDAGIPLVMRYNTDHHRAPSCPTAGAAGAMRDDTGVIFASAFPGYDSFADEMRALLRGPLAASSCSPICESCPRAARPATGTASPRRSTGESPRFVDVRDADPYTFDRRFLFRVLSMGHSQFAELIGARGPNTQVNAACASTTQAVALAEDWIRAGRCRSGRRRLRRRRDHRHMLEWIGAGFLASGAAATDERSRTPPCRSTAAATA